MDPLVNPPADLKVRMCQEYLKQMAVRHAGAVGEFEENSRRVADTEIRATKVCAESFNNGELRTHRQRRKKHPAIR